jgi:hypothetical protein
MNQHSDDRFSRHGSSYGGWTICECATHFEKVGFFISAGVGEDITFDKEMLKISKLLAILVDPTDRAENHVDAYLSTSNQLVELPYLSGGAQTISNYLSTEDIRERVSFVKKALWIHDDGLNLYPPVNSSHVSFKLAQAQGVEIDARNFPSVRIETILETFVTNIRNSQFFSFILLKMDIEGSEFSVLRNLIKANIRPRQLLVELDFMREKNSFIQILRLNLLLRDLKKQKYRLAHIEKLNCLFLQERV